MVVTTSFDSVLDIVVVLDDFHGASEANYSGNVFM